MRYAKVTGIIRASVLDKLVKSLISEGAPGLSVTMLKDRDELKDFFTRDWLVTHARIEVITLESDADRIAKIIVDEEQSGNPGDGIVAILPAEKEWSIRTGDPFIC